MTTAPPLIVLDTNVWVSKQLVMLNTPLATSLLFSLQRRQGYLGLPEVVETELEKVAGDMAVGMAQRFDDAATFLDHLGIQAVSDPPFDLDKIRARATERLSDLEPLLRRTSLTLKHARRALARVNAGLPPNTSKNQQFKDSLLWEAVLDFANEYEVTLITGDKDFFEGRDFSNGIAQSLATEAEPKGIRVLPTNGIADLLEELSDGLTPLETNELRRLIRNRLRPRCEAAARERDFELGDQIGQYEQMFLTQNPGVLAVQFQLQHEAHLRPRDGKRTAGAYWITGSCLYSVDDSEVSDLSISSETISLTQPIRAVESDFDSLDENMWLGPRILFD